MSWLKSARSAGSWTAADCWCARYDNVWYNMMLLMILLYTLISVLSIYDDFSRLSPCKSNMAKDVRLGLTQPHHFWWIEQIDGTKLSAADSAAYILLYAASEAMWGAVRLRISLFRHCTKHLLWVGWMPTSSRTLVKACLVLDCFPFFRMRRGEIACCISKFFTPVSSACAGQKRQHSAEPVLEFHLDSD